MKLNVQRYLRDGKTLADLEADLGIKSSEYGNLVVLNYNQIESPKTDPIVRECRQLVLEKGTWNVVHMSFRRFFNYGEALDLTSDIDYSRAVALEKIDGSIIGVFCYNGKWHMTTRGVIEGDCQVGTFPLTFKQLFDLTVSQYPDFWTAIERNQTQLSQDFCYTFELTSPENRVVTQYADRALHLLTVRDRAHDFHELDMEVIDTIAEAMGVRRPGYHSFSDIAALVKMAAGVGELNEGFVCTTTYKEDGDYRRIKVKNPAYLAVAHLKDSVACSLRGLLYVVMVGEADEFLAYFPEYRQYVDGLREKWDGFKNRVTADLEEAAKIKDIYDRKGYAQWVQSTCRHPGVMFMYLDGIIETFQDWVDQQITKKGEKNFGKMMMKMLKVEDMEWEVQE